MKARTIALGIALCTNIIIAHAQTDSRIYAPNEHIFGMTYGDWSAAWWQFYLQIPSQNHPFLPNTSDTDCHNGTQPAAPVYFLAGVISTTQVVRHCTVPAGSPILFPVANAEWSNLEIPSNPNEAVLNNPSGADLRAVLCNNPFPCPPASSKKALPKSSTLNVSLDGVSISFLNEFHFESPVFSFEPPVPVSNFVFYSNINSPPGGTPISVSDGYWIAIKPLPVGQHILIFSTTGSPEINNLYYLNVQ